MSANLVVLVYPPGKRFFLVKVGLQTDLRQEWEGLAAGHAAFPLGVPRPLALSAHRSFPTLVAEGISFVPLAPHSFDRPSTALRQELGHFFGTARSRFRVASQQSHSSRALDAFAELRDAIPREVAKRYVDDIATELDALPDIAQHGDFYPDNLGMRHGRLVVLDWEDYARECLPGFDVVLLLLSLNHFDVDVLRDNVQPHGRHAWIPLATQVGTGLTAQRLLALLPCCLALLLRMKSALGYGAAFEARALSALRRSLAQRPAEAA